MLRFFTPLLLAMLLMIISISPVNPEIAPSPDTQTYILVIASRDLCHYWLWHPKYHRDSLVVIREWDELPGVLRTEAKRAGNRPVLIDFHVHGAPSGLILCDDTGDEEILDRASFGYVLNRVEEAFRGRRVGLLFESCFAGRAYKNTIRGAKAKSSKDNIEDYPNKVPEIPVYGAGDSFAVVGPVMYVQYVHNIRKWWVALTDYDPLGKDKQLHPIEMRQPGEKMSPTAALTQQFWNFFAYHVP